MTARPDPIVIIEAWLDAEARDRAPQHLLDDTRARVRATRQRRLRTGTWPRRGMSGAGLAVTVAAVVVAVVVVLDLGLPRWAAVGPTATATPTPTSTPRPSGSEVPAPSQASADLIQRGLPGPRGGRPGRYAWIPGFNGWMHNPGNGPGVELYFTELDTRVRRDPTNVLVADHLASYEEHPNATGGLTRLWLMEIEGATIAIRVESSADTVDSDVAEALAIIASMRVEPDRNAFGFMLTFLSPGGWDSG
jgi:hypothetical protein